MRDQHSFKGQQMQESPVSLFAQIQLDKTICWFSAVFHRQQILVLGKKAGQLFLARYDCHEEVEYHDLGQYIEQTEWIFAPENTPDLLLYLPSGQARPPYQLVENEVFSYAIKLHFVHWLGDLTFGVTLCEDGKVAVVYHQDAPKKDWKWHNTYLATLGYFTPEGGLISHQPLHLNGGFRDLYLGFPMRHALKMAAKHGYLYLSTEHNVLLINQEQGYCTMIEYLFNYGEIAIASCPPEILFIVPRAWEQDGRIFFDRCNTAFGSSDTPDIFEAPRLTTNAVSPNRHFEELLSTGFLRQLFFATFNNRVVFFADTKTDQVPKVFCTIPFEESLICGFVLGERNNLSAFLTRTGMVMIYKIAF